MGRPFLHSDSGVAAEPLPDLGDPWELTPSEEDALERGQALEYVRGKWLFDGARTLGELVDRLLDQVERLRRLGRMGYRLVEQVRDDHGALCPPEAAQPPQPDAGPFFRG